LFIRAETLENIKVSQCFGKILIFWCLVVGLWFHFTQKTLLGSQFLSLEKIFEEIFTKCEKIYAGRVKKL
jgi:hypothetical protein